MGSNYIQGKSTSMCFTMSLFILLSLYISIPQLALSQTLIIKKTNG